MRREDTFFNHSQLFNINGQSWNFSRPVIMGIVNITPDSFHAASRAQSVHDTIELIEKQLHEGADWIDIGAVSTRPGADLIDEKTEYERLIPMLKEVVKQFPDLVISADTWRSGIARAAIEAGASIVNDVYSGYGDQNMFKTIADLKVPYIAMHSRGNAQNMHEFATYENITDELLSWGKNILNKLNESGIHQCLIDPGIGFAKTTEQNFKIIYELNQLTQLGYPLLIGISRKRFIANTLGTTTEHSLNGTSALHMMCLHNGASVLRVHDVKEAVEVRELFLNLKK